MTTPQKGAEAADDDDDQGGRDDFSAHGWMDGVDRAKQDAGQTSQADAEACDNGHVGLQRNAEGARPCPVLHARRARRGRTRSLKQQPQACDTYDRK